jgi:hypothetical protein
MDDRMIRFISRYFPNELQAAVGLLLVLVKREIAPLAA